MSLRESVISHLRTALPDVSGRVYQAFLAPSLAETPHITVKLPARIGGQFGSQPVEVYMYAAPGSFVTLDRLEHRVIETLHDQGIKAPVGASWYVLRYSGSAGDVADPERKLISRVVVFTAASAMAV